MRVAAMGQLKGGTGKSTACINAAVAAGQLGFSVAIADTDPQGSSTAWAAARNHSLPHVEALPAAQLRHWLASNATFDLVLVDTPAHDIDVLAEVTRIADLTIIVTQATYWANAVATHIRNAFVAEEIPYAILMAQTPARLCRRLDHWLTLHRELGTVIDSHLAYRVAYQDAVPLGLGVVEYEPDGAAAREVRAATDWILRKVELMT